MISVSCETCHGSFEAKRSDARFCKECTVIRRRGITNDSNKRHKNQCIDCKEFTVDRHYKEARCRPCRNRYMAQFQIGEHNPTWKGGRSMRKGYVTVLVGGRHRDEHRVVWEEANGPIPNGYVVHHVNGTKTDNRLENLLAVPRHQHHSEPHKVIELYEKRIKELERQLESYHSASSLIA